MDRVLSEFSKFCYNYFETAAPIDVIRIITDYNNLANIVYVRDSMETKQLINQADRILRKRKKDKKN